MNAIFKLFLTAVAFISAGCAIPSAQDIMGDLKRETGLREASDPDLGGKYLQGVHRGYPVLYRAEAGNVWGRYAARIAISEIGKEIGGVARFLTGSYEHLGARVVGSPADRLLAQIIGQPISVFITLRHGKPNASRLDILSDFAKSTPDDLEPEADYIGFKVGSFYSKDAELIGRLKANKALMERLPNYRTQYIRLDERGVSFMFAGSETDYSAMINENGGFTAFIKGVMDTLADIADAA